MTKQELVRELESRGYNNDAKATQQDLYTTINRSQLFSDTNRLNAGWARGKYVIATYSPSSTPLSSYLEQWRQKTRNYKDQTLCLEVESGQWKFFDYDGVEISYAIAFPQVAQKLPTIPTTISNSELKETIHSPALRTKPFMLLAGISGTGKSRIVKEMAFQTCPDKDGLQDDAVTPGNYCLVEVKPNWHDSTELLGYKSVLTEHYVATKFVKFLAKAMCHPDVPFFVCLDEMNLAPVEQYFAEFLSVLESRKKGDDDKITSEPLIPASVFCDDEEHLYNALFGPSTTIEEGVQMTFVGQESQVYETLKRDGLRIPSNLIVVGTVNMDETTHQFSRKVIDRAMTIEMNIEDGDAPFREFFNTDGDLKYSSTPISKEVFLSRYVTAKQAIEELNGEDQKMLCDEVPNILAGINKALDGTPFKVAYRVQNELIIYFAELRRFNTGAKAEELLTQAIDDILMMKVLPRVEGDNDLLEEPLKELAKLAEGRYLKAHQKVEEMQIRLDKNHFTSFWP